MKKILIVLTIIVAASFSGCIEIHSNSRNIDYSERMAAFDEMGAWCVFSCYLKKDLGLNRYLLDVVSGGDGNVTISFEFEDSHATIYAEDYMCNYSIGNRIWRTYALGGGEFKWYFDIFSDFDKNVTIRIVKDLESFPLCENCNFQQIIKEKTFTPNNIQRGFL